MLKVALFSIDKTVSLAIHLKPQGTRQQVLLHPSWHHGSDFKMVTLARTRGQDEGCHRSSLLDFHANLILGPTCDLLLDLELEPPDPTPMNTGLGRVLGFLPAKMPPNNLGTSTDLIEPAWLQVIAATISSSQ
jgi:hypothetical protein